ncbi:hypothetical protein FXF51_00695 [Nonomuraea sp. PA05]|nr:hypothetical protein [Nonomuraea sp. PA05]TYB70993.1 hypothetical protein FXF51_00695 [Nonomuraea sp. PA05]
MPVTLRHGFSRGSEPLIPVTGSVHVAGPRQQEGNYMEMTSHNEFDRHEGRGPVLVDIADIIVSEESVAALQDRQLWMRPQRDVGH